MTHTTKYGNTYTDQEWAEMQAYFREEKANDEAISAKMLGLEKFLRRQLREEGLDQKQEDTVARLFRYGNYEEANTQFTSKGRQATLQPLKPR